MPRSRLVGASILVLTSMLSASACGSDKPDGPTVAEAEQTLKTHITKLVGVGVGNVRHIKVIDPGGKDVPCGDNKAKRTYAVTGDKKDPEKDDLSLTPIDLSNSMYGRLITRVAKYEPVDIKPGDPTQKTRNPESGTNITIKVPAKGIVEIYGSTDCLHVD